MKLPCNYGKFSSKLFWIFWDIFLKFIGASTKFQQNYPKKFLLKLQSKVVKICPKWFLNFRLFSPKISQHFSKISLDICQRFLGFVHHFHKNFRKMSEKFWQLIDNWIVAWNNDLCAKRNFSLEPFKDVIRCSFLSLVEKRLYYNVLYKPILVLETTWCMRTAARIRFYGKIHFRKM